VHQSAVGQFIPIYQCRVLVAGAREFSRLKALSSSSCPSFAFCTADFTIMMVVPGMPVLSAVQSRHYFAGLAGIPRCASGERGSGSQG
jgi:hypothetical protein